MVNGIGIQLKSGTHLANEGYICFQNGGVGGDVLTI